MRSQILGLIERGELSVGQRLPPEKELADSLGVSRPVVREALGSLRAIGMIVSQHGRGSFVASDSTQQPLLLGRYTPTELHDVRRHLEVPGAGIAAERCTAADGARLHELIELMEATPDVSAWVRLDAEFHVAIAQATQNDLQGELVEGLRELHVELSTRAISLEGRRGEAEREHRAIHDAVRSHDVAAAEEAMTEHLVNGCRIWTTLANRTDRMTRAPTDAGQR